MLDGDLIEERDKRVRGRGAKGMREEKKIEFNSGGTREVGK